MELKLKKKGRFEYKYICNEQTLFLLRSRMDLIMKKDPHVREEGYQIRSVYFDDYQNTCYYKNEQGVDPRAKYRIRIYDGSDRVIKLEKKVKENGKTRKHTANLSREQAESLISGQCLSLKAEEMEKYQPLLKEFLVLMQTRRMMPAVIVIYDRIPYIEKNGNVRVTLDLNISSSLDFAHFFESDIRKTPIMPSGVHLLEVKYDSFLPRVIKTNLDLGTLRQETFSKYYLCRKQTMSQNGH